jgi:hypothetical protein
VNRSPSPSQPSQRRHVQPARRKGRRLRRRTILLIATASLAIGAVAAATNAALANSHGRRGGHRFEVESLDGSGNNRAHPDWGKAGTPYSRVAAPNYADGHSAMPAGPNSRWISNRLINDENQNVFSDRQLTQWVWTWGQFLDHTIGLAQGGGPAANIPFNAKDPMESFTDSMGVVPFTRDAAAPGTGTRNARQQVNTVNSYVDAWAVYGGTNDRLEFLRAGPFDGNLANNSAKLALNNGYLLTRDARGDASKAPDMVVDGRLVAQPTKAVVAGDVRANENVALTATQTLFAREHNRIVSKLPNSLSQEQKFQIARRVVAAEEQWITYQQFLPAMGVRLPAYRGYNSHVDTSLSNEFATVGYRGHSQIHGEFEVDADADRYSAAQLDAFEKQGIEIQHSTDGKEVTLVIPLNVAFFNPGLLPQIGEGPMLKAIGAESQYNNDEMIDNQLRSTLFQVPVAGNTGCLDGADLPKCFTGVVDLGALDIERGRDHGMPSYNDLRKAYGLAPKTTFKAITGESTEAFPADPTLTKGHEVDDPNSLDFTALFDVHGKKVTPGTPDAENTVTRGVRRTPLAARMKAVYGSVDKVDAFMGMIAEKHLPGSEMGELQTAIWARQFAALRDGDRFFYGNDPALNSIRRAFGIDFRKSLADVIALNTDVDKSELNKNVFVLGAKEDSSADGPAAAPDDTPTDNKDSGTQQEPAVVPAGAVPAGAGRRMRRRG